MTEVREEEILSAEEREILQEVMNIAFGQASADLAEVIDIHVVLNVPRIKVIRAGELPEYMQKIVEGQDIISVVRQSYLGKFRGVALLVFPQGAGVRLLKMLGEGNGEVPDPLVALNMAKDALLETGNILIGACVGKVADLLDDLVTYTPPEVVIEESPKDMVPQGMFDPQSTAIVMKTVFGFEDRDMEGYLFLINSQDSIGWLKKALFQFVERFM